MATEPVGAGPWLTVVGSTMIDLVAYAQRMPESGETVFGDRFAQGFGGKGANQAVMARLMGAHVAMVNAVGEDGYGEQTLANFERYGIDTTHVRRVPGASGVAPIWVEPNGANRIVVIPGANYGLQPEHGAAAIKEQAQVDIVIGQFEIKQAVTTAAFRAARERGAMTLLNPAPAAAIDPSLAAVSDWIMPNENEFAILAQSVGTADDVDDPAALASTAEALGTRLLVTLGERGVALVGTDGQVSQIPTSAVTAVDTTGAGDAFVGAFAFGLASGWHEVDAIRLGCAIAAESVQQPGTQTSFPVRERCNQIIANVAASASSG